MANIEITDLMNRQRNFDEQMEKAEVGENEIREKISKINKLANSVIDLFYISREAAGSDCYGRSNILTPEVECVDGVNKVLIRLVVLFNGNYEKSGIGIESVGGDCSNKMLYQILKNDIINPEGLSLVSSEGLFKAERTADIDRSEELINSINKELCDRFELSENH